MKVMKNMRKKKIVVVGTRGIPNIMGGVETHCEELFPRLAAKGYDIIVFRRSAYVDSDVDAASGVKLHIWKGIRLIDLKSPKAKAFEAIIHTVKAVCVARWIGADVVHVHAVGPALVVPFARLLGLKVVFTHHGPDYDRDKWCAAAKFVLRMGQFFGCLCANRVIVISEVIKQLIADSCGRRKRVHLIYNGVPEPEICHNAEYFRSLGIEEGNYILGMCRFVPEKHLHDLVRAYTIARERFEKSNNNEIQNFPRLVLAGDSDFDDDYSRNLKKEALENGVVLTGFVRGEKLHSLLTNAKCYSLPSSHEGLPISLLEAMSYSLPVIVSAIPANIEIGLDKDCYHNVGDVEVLADKLFDIATKPLVRVKYNLEKYNWDNIASQVSEVYELL